MCQYRSGKEYTKTVDGLETMFAVNHLGVFLFTNLLVPQIIKAGPGARIVCVSSRGHQRTNIRWDDWGFSVRLALFLALLQHVYQGLQTDKHIPRTEKHTTHSYPTANQKQQTSSLQNPSPLNSHQRASRHSRYTQVAS
jgi:NAD(P)-dependent dehydrogenase (short-subunit alcohol dehydrogenase family)